LSEINILECHFGAAKWFVKSKKALMAQFIACNRESGEELADRLF
jgi:hypothetical protein